MRSNVGPWRRHRIFDSARLHTRELTVCGSSIGELNISGTFTNLHCYSGHHPERRLRGDLRWPLIADRHMYKCAICLGDSGWWKRSKVSVARLRQLQPRMLSL